MVSAPKTKQARPPKKLKQKQAQQDSHDILFIQSDEEEEEEQQDNHPKTEHQLPPPLRKEKKQDKQQRNKKKRTFDDSLEGPSHRKGGSNSTSASTSSLRKTGSNSGTANSEETAEQDDEDAEPDKQANTAEIGHHDDDDEADDETDKRHKPLAKKQKRDLPAAAATTTNSFSSVGPVSSAGGNRLVLRLPKRSKGFGPSASSGSTTSPPKSISKNNSPQRNATRHPGGSLVGTVRTSPQSSSETSERNLKLAGGTVPALTLDNQHMSGFEYASDSSDGYSDLLEDDEDDLLEAEEAYLIADKIHRQERHSRRTSGSPGAIRDSDGHHSGHQSESENMPVSIQDGTQPPASQNANNLHHDTVFFGIAPENATGSEYDAESGLDFPVTWSGAEDDELPDDLDEFLGITTEDSVAILGISTANGDDTEEDHLDDGETMRFEDFLGQDDGDDSSDRDSTEEESSSEEEQSVAATRSDALERDDDEFLETTEDVIKKGGFVFFKGRSADREQMFDGDETESEIGDISPEQEDDGGDTTDTLDDTDHLGMIRFGIEAADEDDEDAEEMLANAIRDRNLIDAHNMGLSVSIDALATQPEAVVKKTARSLGVTTEMAAKILTSVGMSILVNSGSSREFFDRHTASDAGSSTAALPMAGDASPAPAIETAFKEPNHPTASGSGTHAGAQRAAQDPKPAQKTFIPVLGDFEPSREADLCVVVGPSEAPAPSPFSARKRRTRATPRQFAHGSPNARGQSVVSSISSQSAVSGQHAYRSTSSEEPHYNFILELDDLVDPRMLPGTMSSVSEEEEDMDDSASVSTGFGAGLHPVAANSVGDVSRWNRIPIGAFRSQGPDAFASIASAVFSGSRDPAAARDLSFHGGVTFNTSKAKSRGGKRYIPVSPVLFPVGHSLRSIAAAPSSSKSRSKSRTTKGSKKASKAARLNRHHRKDSPATTGMPSSTSSFTNGHFNSSLQPPPNQGSLPSDGLTHHVSPLFSSVGNTIAIPHLSL